MNVNHDDDDIYTPDWARPLGARGYRSFLSLVENYFITKQIRIAIDNNAGLIKPDLGSIPLNSTFGLQNIAQICQQSDRDKWRDLIKAHFDSIFEVSADESALSVPMSDFATVKSRLRSRLYPVDVVNHASEVVYRSGPEGTLEVLAIDLPTTVRTVSKSEMDGWGMGAEELFVVGQSNLRQAGLLIGNTVQLDEGIAITLYSGDAFYAASHALIIDAYLPRENPHGVLVGIPKRDVMLTHTIRNVGAMEAAVAMLQVIIGMHQDGPGAISPFLYWHVNDQYVTLPYELEGKSLRFFPTDEFVELIDELGEVASYS